MIAHCCISNLNSVNSFINLFILCTRDMQNIKEYFDSTVVRALSWKPAGCGFKSMFVGCFPNVSPLSYMLVELPDPRLKNKQTNLLIESIV